MLRRNRFAPCGFEMCMFKRKIVDAAVNKQFTKLSLQIYSRVRVGYAVVHELL